MTSIEMGAMATAGLGGVMGLWGQIKGLFARIESLIIVKADIIGEGEGYLMGYLWEKYKASRIGVRRFDSQNTFIRPKNRYGITAIEHSGSFLTFWDGWKPLFVSISKNQEGYYNGVLTVTFIRGMFDIEDLMIKAAEFADTSKHEKNGKNSRYYVKKVFGRKRRKNDDQEDAPTFQSKNMAESNMSNGARPLFYKREDLGMPHNKSPLDNLSYGPAVEEFYEEVRRWKESEQWFKEKGLPWRFGALLSGEPGTGKTSLARAIGQSLDMPIHSYDLTSMDNQELMDNWQYSLTESPCVVLLEDIDRIFDESRQIKTANDKAPLTLDCLLNCISGVQASDGILVLVTANDVTKLDSALGVPDSTGKSTRPGRLDRAVYIGVLDKRGREKIAKRILSDTPELIDETVRNGDGETGAQFESRCAKLALSKRYGGFKIYGENIPVTHKSESSAYN